MGTHTWNSVASVWWADATPSWDHLLPLLDADERTRLNGYQRSDDCGRFVVGAALAKIAVAELTAMRPAEVRLLRTCPRCGKPHGKPRIVHPPRTGLELSVSHATALVGVAVTAAAPVGIDVEKVASVALDELAPVALAPRELRAVAAAEAGERDRAFLVLWTRKEAAAKAVGQGLRLDPREIAVSSPDEPPRLLAWPHGVAPDAVALFDLRARPGYVAALAALGPCIRVVERDLHRRSPGKRPSAAERLLWSVGSGGHDAS